MDAAEGVNIESRGLIRDKKQVNMLSHKVADSDSVRRATQLELVVGSHDRIDTDASGESDGGVSTSVLESCALGGIELDLFGACVSAYRAFDGCQGQMMRHERCDVLANSRVALPVSKTTFHCDSVIGSQEEDL